MAIIVCMSAFYGSGFNLLTCQIEIPLTVKQLY